MGCGQRGRASGHLDPNQMPARHGLRISRLRRPVPMPDLDQSTVPSLVAITSRIGWLPDLRDLAGRRLEGRIWTRGRPTGEPEADLPGRRRLPPQTWPPGAEDHAHPGSSVHAPELPVLHTPDGTTKCRRGAPIGGCARRSATSVGLSVTTCMSGMAAGSALLEPVHRPLAVARYRRAAAGREHRRHYSGSPCRVACGADAGSGYPNTMSAFSDRSRPSRRSML